MLIKIVFIAAICMLGVFFLFPAFSCVYTVRDVGFADMGSVPYLLYYYIQDDTPEKLTSTFKQISYAALMDSNVEVEIIIVGKSKIRPDYDQAMKYLDFWEIKSFPAAILVSPKGRSLVLSISASDGDSKTGVWSALEEVVISPKRKEILSSIIKAYCVVLLVEGKNAAENKKAKKVVEGTIEELSEMMSQMPKSVEKPPHLIAMPQKSLSQERVLLWSLGVDRNSAKPEPYVTVLYGRGRQIGQLFKGENITANGVFNILSVIGGSCECGLDRAWLAGTMLPLRWGGKTQSQAAKSLGFDVESPMIKMEMSQILSLGSSSGVATSPLEGYSETVVEFEGGGSQSAVSPAQFRQLVSDESAAPKTGMASYTRIFLLVAGGVVLLILVGGVLVILRSRRRVS